MRQKQMLTIVLALGMTGATGLAQDYSIDQASPEYPATFSSADIVSSGGILIFNRSTSLGLAATDEIDAFSYGRDSLVPAGSNNWVALAYSVTRGTLGLGGGAVATQVAGNGAAGDKFSMRIRGNGALLGAPRRRSDAVWHMLTPTPGVQSDLDGLSNWGWPSVATHFSVDGPTGGAYGWGTADVLYQPAPGPAAPPVVVYATAAALGLNPNDDIDALAIKDLGGEGVLSPSDIVYVSLKPGSPTLAANGWSPASVLQVNPGPITEIFVPADFGLRASDDLNAITGYDPGLHSDVQTVPALTGGVVNFSLDAGPGQANRQYIMLASLSGNSPGMMMPGGHTLLPLNFDALTNLMISINPPGFLGVLDGNGQRQFPFMFPAVGVPYPLPVTFAFTLMHPYDHVSDHLEIVITP